MSRLDEAFAVLDEGYELHKPPRMYALFSGGHDSLSAASVAFAWARDRGIHMEAAHIRTGTGVPQTTEYVQATCATYDWPLRIFDPPVSFEEIVLEYGFPGPGQHGLVFQRLKERCLRQLVREAKDEVIEAGERESRERNRFKIGLVTGVRSQESVRRMRHVERIQIEGGKLWLAPVWNWSKVECAKWCFKENDFERNPVVDLMHMSGECRCGAFARPGELQEWMEWFPDETRWILDLQERVEAKGLRACRWGQRPPRVHREQMRFELAGPELDEAGFPVAPEAGMLCVGCDSRLALEEEEAVA